MASIPRRVSRSLVALPAIGRAGRSPEHTVIGEPPSAAAEIRKNPEIPRPLPKERPRQVRTQFTDYGFTVTWSWMVCVTLPLAAVTTTLEVVAVALLLLLQPESCATPIAPAISTRARKSPRRFFHPRKQRAIANVAPPARKGLERCRRAALLPSVSVRAVEALWPFVGVTVAGLKLQVSVDGRVEQVNVVAELNPY